jgi:hypothetical protein
VAANGRKDCPIHRRLLDEYNRAFHSWVAHTGEGEELETLIDTTESQRLAVARVEEKHQQLLQHEQCCSNCNENGK